MTDQKFDVHFWGIPNRRAGHKKDIWSVGNWPLSEFADRVPRTIVKNMAPQPEWDGNGATIPPLTIH